MYKLLSRYLNEKYKIQMCVLSETLFLYRNALPWIGRVGL